MIDMEEADMQAQPSNFTTGQWAIWIVGYLFIFFLTFLRLKWGTKLQSIQGEAEVLMEEVEKAAEAIEKVAEVAEKVSEEVVDSLPGGNTDLKQAALQVERASKATAHDARLTQEFIHQFERIGAMEQDLQDQTLTAGLVVEN